MVKQTSARWAAPGQYGHIWVKFVGGPLDGKRLQKEVTTRVLTARHGGRLFMYAHDGSDVEITYKLIEEEDKPNEASPV